MAIIAFIFGFLACAAVLLPLWIMRELERARAFKALRERIEDASARMFRARRLITYLYEGISEIRNHLGGRVMLPAPAIRPVQLRVRETALLNGAAIQRRGQ